MTISPALNPIGKSCQTLCLLLPLPKPQKPIILQRPLHLSVCWHKTCLQRAGGIVVSHIDQQSPFPRFHMLQIMLWASFTFELFKQFWGLIENEFTNALIQFQQSVIIPLGKPHLIFILKSNNPVAIQDYILICFSNVTYKILTKTLMNKNETFPS